MIPVRIVTAGAVAIALSATTWTLLGGGETARLHAAPVSTTPGDNDRDGLPDLLESRLGLSPDLVDTDNDSFSDAEELARHSDGSDPASIPGSDPVSVNLEVYQDGGPIRPVSVLYNANGDFSNLTLGMGARVGGILRNAPVAFFTGTGSTTELKSGKKTGSIVMIIDGVFDASHVVRFGSLSLFTTVGDQSGVIAADVSNLADKNGTIVEYSVISVPAPLVAGGSRGGGFMGLYTPIDSSPPPVDWTPGEICAQTVVVAGTLGPVVVQEVVEAECESGWDAYCDPNCAATVGSTIETLDPGALIGG